MKIIETNLKFTGSLSKRLKTDMIILHHAEASKCSVEDIHKWHLEFGWSGFGYHFLVRKDGSIYRGRPENTVGAHCQGRNSTSIGICAEGSYMIETMPEVQKKAIIELVNYLKNKYNVSKVYGHREVGSSNCPGTNYPLEQIKKGEVNVVEEKKEQPILLVKATQELLNKIGITDDAGGKLSEDGLYGEKTKEAYIKFKVIEFEKLINK